MRDMLKFTLAIAKEGGAIALGIQGKLEQLSIEFKGEKDLVTEADKSVERYLIGEISRRFPSHGILAEESGESGGDGEFVWSIDPIDGTTSFVHDQPFFSISIALKRDGESVIGVVNAPRLGEIYYASKGGGAYRNGDRIGVSSRQRLLDSVLSTGFACVRTDLKRNNIPLFNEILPKIRDVRRFGSAAIDLSYVACGRLDGYWEMSLKPYDVAAGELIVREAGGTVSDFEGGMDYPARGTVATNGRIAAELLSISRSVVSSHGLFQKDS